MKRGTNLITPSGQTYNLKENKIISCIVIIIAGNKKLLLFIVVDVHVQSTM